MNLYFYQLNCVAICFDLTREIDWECAGCKFNCKLILQQFERQEFLPHRSFFPKSKYSKYGRLGQSAQLPWHEKSCAKDKQTMLEILFPVTPFQLLIFGNYICSSKSLKTFSSVFDSKLYFDQLSFFHFAVNAI